MAGLRHANFAPVARVPVIYQKRKLIHRPKMDSDCREMKKLNKQFEPVVYKGAGHGFMRTGDGPNPSQADKRARDEPWVGTRNILKAL